MHFSIKMGFIYEICSILRPISTSTIGGLSGIHDDNVDHVDLRINQLFDVLTFIKGFNLDNMTFLKAK